VNSQEKEGNGSDVFQKLFTSDVRSLLRDFRECSL
jgi:hypothetical protein